MFPSSSQYLWTLDLGFYVQYFRYQQFALPRRFIKTAKCLLTCIIVHQYNETSVMHFPFNLLRIKGLYMFRALLAHPQEALQTAFGILREYNASWL
jgi:hypothetical protein